MRVSRPEELNAVSDKVMRQLTAAFRRFDLDADTLEAFQCGRGRAFSSGTNVQQRQLRPREELESPGRPQGHSANAADSLFQSVNSKPVIAAVHGYVLGLDPGMVPDCDLIVAEAGTRFQVTETSRGLGVAKHRAPLHFRCAGAFGDEVTLTGRYFSAEEALAASLDQPGSVKGPVHRVGPGTCCRGRGQSAAVGACDGQDAAVASRSPSERSGFSASAHAAVSDRRFPRGCAGLRRKTQAWPV